MGGRGVREARLFSRFWSFRRSAVLFFPVQSSSLFRTSVRWIIGCKTISGISSSIFFGLGDFSTTLFCVFFVGCLYGKVRVLERLEGGDAGC